MDKLTEKEKQKYYHILIEFKYNSKEQICKLKDEDLKEMEIVGADKKLMMECIIKMQSENLPSITFTELSDSQKEYKQKASKIEEDILSKLISIGKQIPEQLTTSHLEEAVNQLVSMSNTLKEESSRILVMGDVKAGKSLFINTCLNVNLLPSEEIKCTSVPTKIEYKEKRFYVKTKKYDNQKNRKEVDFLKTIEITKEEMNHFKIHERLSVKTPEKQETIENKREEEWKIEIDEKLENSDFDYQTLLRQFLTLNETDRDTPTHSLVEIGFDCEILKSGIVFVDSPGVNENGFFDEMVETEVKSSIGVVCLINANQQLTKSCITLLNKLKEHPSFSCNHLFFLVTHWDQIKRKEHLKEQIEISISKIFQNFNYLENIHYVNLEGASQINISKTNNLLYNDMMQKFLVFFKNSFNNKINKILKQSKIFSQLLQMSIQILNKSSNKENNAFLELEKNIHQTLEKINHQNQENMIDLEKQVKEEYQKYICQMKEFPKAPQFKEILKDKVKDYNITKHLNLGKKRVEWENDFLIFLGRTVYETLKEKDIEEGMFKKMLQHFEKKIQEITEQLEKSLVLIINAIKEEDEIEENLCHSLITENDPKDIVFLDYYIQPYSFLIGNTINKSNSGLKRFLSATGTIFYSIFSTPVTIFYFPITSIKSRITYRSDNYIRNHQQETISSLLENFFEKTVKIVFETIEKESISKVKEIVEKTKTKIEEKIKFFSNQLSIIEKHKNIILQTKPTFEKLLFEIKGIDNCFFQHLQISELNKNIVFSNYIDSGAFGKVYKANWLIGKEEKQVAVKVVQLSKNQINPNMINTFLNEHSFKETKNEYLVEIFDVLKDETDTHQRFYIVMEIADCNLTHLISKKQFTDQEAINYSLDVIEGIKFLHKKMNFSHRDIKPDNVLLFGKRAKLSDFGTSKFVSLSSSTIVGTPKYLASEVWEGNYDFSVDIFSFGVLLFELFSRNMVFGEAFGVNFSFHHYLSVYPRLLNELPLEISSLIKQSVSLDPSRRPSCEDLISSLKKYKNNLKSSN